MLVEEAEALGRVVRMRSGAAEVVRWVPKGVRGAGGADVVGFAEGEVGVECEAVVALLMFRAAMVAQLFEIDVEVEVVGVAEVEE